MAHDANVQPIRRIQMDTPRQVWFVTGASSGFGRAFAEEALKGGHSVVVAARSTAKLTEMMKLAPERVLAVTLDINEPTQLQQAVKETLDRFGRVDVLVNNAGYGIVGAVEETPDHELRAQMETNFFGAVAVTRAFLPTMRAQKSGAIVNMSSLGGQVSFAGFGAYSASKFALEGISEALAHELKPFGIKVLIVEPGAFRTRFAGSALKYMPMMEAYDESVAETRKFARKMNDTQEGDPRKAVRAIRCALEDSNTPLRLQLGADAVKAVRSHGETLLVELARWEQVALNTKVAGAAAAPGSGRNEAAFTEGE
jgi:NAD(P)-dependent dehydrogenase (short-subunit alcohol dehydrogenase family)